MKIEEVKNHILEQIQNGATGSETMNLYNYFSGRAANAAIRELLDEGKITISSPVTGYRLRKSDEYGVSQALKTHNFDVRKA